MSCFHPAIAVHSHHRLHRYYGSDTNPDSHPNAYANRNTTSHIYTNTYSQPHTYANSNTYSDTLSNAYSSI